MSASSSTSPRKCETRMTVRPPADRPLTISWKRWISDADSAAVGSSKTMSSASRASARRISTCCCTASGNAPTVAFAGTSKPAPATTRRNRSSSSPSPDEAEPSRLGAEEHVLGDRPLRDQRDLLGDHRDPALERRAGRTEAHRLAAQVQLALVLREHARDDLAEGGLAGSVLADEGMNGAGANLHRDLVQGTSATERLADPADVEVDLAGSHGPMCRTGQPGHSASVRNWSTLSFVTTPPSGRSARTSIPGWTSPPARMASMNICVPRPPSVAGACIVVP